LESRVSWKIFGSKREERRRWVTKERNEELWHLWGSPNVARLVSWRRIRWTGWTAGFWWRKCVEGVEGTALVGSSLGSARSRSEDNIQKGRKEYYRKVLVWIIWLRAVANGGLFCNMWWTFIFHKCEEFCN